VSLLPIVFNRYCGGILSGRIIHVQIHGAVMP
jgi:hypothetical protein